MKKITLLISILFLFISCESITSSVKNSTSFVEKIIPSKENLSKWNMCKDSNAHKKKSYLPCECKAGYKKKTRDGKCIRIHCSEVTEYLKSKNSDNNRINWNYYEYNNCKQKTCDKIAKNSKEPCMKVDCNKMPKGNKRECNIVSCDKMPRWNKKKCIPMCRNIPLLHTGFYEKKCACNRGFAPTIVNSYQTGKCVKARHCQKGYELFGSIQSDYKCVKN